MKRLVLLLFLFCTIAWAHTFHGAAMAPNTLKGWVVASDTWGYVLHTPDGGLTWINQSFSTWRHFYDVFFLNEQKGWIGTDQGYVFYSLNGGQNWYPQGQGIAYFAYRILFINDSCGWAACSDAVIGRTVCGNDTTHNWQTWQQIVLPDPPFTYDMVAFNGVTSFDSLTCWLCGGKYPEYYPWPPETLYTKGQGYIVKLTNGGQNWQLLLRDTIYDFFDIKFHDTLNGFIVGGNDRTMSANVMRTFNGGNTWQNVIIPSQAKYLRSVKFVGNHAWAVGHSGTIIHSNNSGNSWQIQTSNVNTTLYDVDFADTLHGLIAGDSYVLYTYNSGNTWNIANVGIEEESPMLNAIHPMLEVYPNPAKRLTAIRFSLPAESKVSLQLYDISGRLVKTLVNESKKSGIYNVPLNTEMLSAGVYFLSLETKEKRIIERVVVVK